MHYFPIKEQTGWRSSGALDSNHKVHTVYVCGMSEPDAMAVALGGTPPPGSCKDPRIKFIETIGIEDGQKVTLEVLIDLANKRASEIAAQFNRKESYEQPS